MSYSINAFVNKTSLTILTLSYKYAFHEETVLSYMQRTLHICNQILIIKYMHN